MNECPLIFRIGGKIDFITLIKQILNDRWSCLVTRKKTLAARLKQFLKLRTKE